MQGVFSRAQSWCLTLTAVAILAFLAKLVIAAHSYGSLDAMLRELNFQDLRHEGALDLYRHQTIVHLPGLPDHREVFNHPPFVIRLLALWGWLADLTKFPLRFWVRASCALADVAGVYLLAGITWRVQPGFRPAGLLLVAASPVSLLISGFHCNYDPIMMSLVLLSLYFLIRERIFLAGMALGAAIDIKIVPLIFLPAIVLYLRGRKRWIFVAACIGAFVVLSLPFICQEPLLIWRQVFGYTPQLVTGRWGLSRLILVFAPVFFNLFSKSATIPLLVLIGLISILMNRKRSRPPLYLQIGLVAFLFVALIPGFGVQYLAWLVPWTCFLTFRQSLAFHTTGGLLLFAYYTRASNGLPWNFAYNGQSEWYGSVTYIGLLCWIVVCWLTVTLARKLMTSAPSEAVPEIRPPAPGRWVPVCPLQR